MGQEIGRLAMRHEGDLWVARYALRDTMEDAVFLGSIAMAGITSNPERKSGFMDMMKEMVADIIEDRIGERPDWNGERKAPEHERAGRA